MSTMAYAIGEYEDDCLIPTIRIPPLITSVSKRLEAEQQRLVEAEYRRGVIHAVSQCAMSIRDATSAFERDTRNACVRFVDGVVEDA